MNFTEELSLDRIRRELIRLEDSILFALIERAQFAVNPPVYAPGTGPPFLDAMLRDIECVHAKYRRFTSPDEYPFTPLQELPSPVLPPMTFPPVLAHNSVNLNSRLKDIYVSEIVPLICAQGDDGNYGSAATRDIEALQLISRRIHFGKFVAEAKFMDPKEHDLYVELIKKSDSEGIRELLTYKAVEERLLERVKRKAAIYGQDLMSVEAAASTSPTTKNAVLENLKIPLQVVSDIYEKIIIPLTKDVEVDYLLQRLESGEASIN